ncbi:N-6 DNA methylase [Kitasatospora kifunensis]|uniref:Putative DNA-binding transcriptional regulator AlpA n=1 Tax=Kitasatospora kifunensis TaxID=58351 RepID=A0A7W7QYY8_KITKI|nr:N-6 DNA methylase [Kitasatospora kifunensis]MBB4922398.1 putative DNA-binding transcriptional regulator AlpA [Kitasatospora kifunensis]
MKQPAEPAVSVTLAEIARIAGVGRAAVSNWRRRHESFPNPVGGSDTSPQFSLAEVEEWLDREKKSKPTAGRLERLWPQVEALGDRNSMGRVLSAVGAELSAPGTADTLPIPLELSPEQRALAEQAVRLAQQEGASETFGFLLQRWLGTHVRQIITTPEPLAELMVDIAQWHNEAPVRTVIDPACGTGSLLLAAGRRWADSGEPKLLGQDSEPVLAAVAAARLLLEGMNSRIMVADTLRADALQSGQADVVLCNPPSNERDWGHAEVATDPRWLFGQPPRTEPELAWVQHSVATLAPGGTAVMVLPPAVSARRAGRRIRSALLRTGALRAVIALPPGAAPPHGVGLHLWVLSQPCEDPSGAVVRLVDSIGRDGAPSAGRSVIDWPTLRTTVLESLQSDEAPAGVSVPVIDLLDEQVDLTPARYVPAADSAITVNLRQAWTRFDLRLSETRDLSQTLSKLTPMHDEGTVTSTTVAELELAGALELRTGQALPEQQLHRGDPPPDAVRALAIPDLVHPEGPRHWLSALDTESGERAGTLTVTSSQDIVVVGAFRAFDAWVDVEAPTVLGPQLHLIRVDPTVLDPWFLAGCLRSPSNARQAGTHASTSSRVDVRRLQVPRLPLDEQRAYGEIYRRLTAFDHVVRELGEVAGSTSRALGELLATGRLPRG